MLRAAIERAVAEKDQQESASSRRSTSATSSSRSRFPGSSYENATAPAVLAGRSRWPRSTSVAKSWVSDRNRVVVVNAPDKPGLAVPTEAEARGRHQGRVRKEAERVRRCGRHPQPLVDDAADTGHRREGGDEGRLRHHRVGAVERREGRAQADDIQGGRDGVPRVQPGRHVARERSGLRLGRDRDAGRRAPAGSASSTPSTSGSGLTGKVATVQPDRRRARRKD